MTENWRQNLKPGDKVLHYNNGRTGFTIKSVSRTTKLHIITHDDVKYQIKNGYRAGIRDQWNSYWIEPYDAAKVKKELERRKKAVHIQDIKELIQKAEPKDHSLETLELIKVLLLGKER